VDALTAQLPEGPYRLGGWSMGGVIALEMAGQLVRAGHEVELVAVVDLMEPPGPAEHQPADDATLMTWFAGDLAGLSGRGWNRPVSALAGTPDRSSLVALHEELRRAEVLPADVDRDTLGRIVDRFARNARALLRHEPTPYFGRVSYYRGADGGATMDTVRHWMKLLSADARVVDLPGDHYSVMQGVGLRMLADDLGREPAEG